MDPVTLIVGAVAFAGSCIAQKCADAALEAAWARITAAFRDWRGTEATAESIDQMTPDSTEASALLTEADQIFGRSSGLRRARMVESILDGARILWIDDHPENNAWERTLFRAFGVETTSVETTASAVDRAGHQQFDVIVSDIAREGRSDEGLRALGTLSSEAAGIPPVIFYVGRVTSRAVPAGAFGLTNDPNELLHLVMDVLERSRV